MPSGQTPEKHRAKNGDAAANVPDFLPLRKDIGVQIRLWRKKSGMTLRALEARSGVSNSEISKVEKGSQACRLESFIRICAALGLPAGYILDHAVVFNSAAFEAGIRSDPMMQGICAENKAIEQIMVQTVAVFAAFASQLVLCSQPVKKASMVRYLHGEIEKRFVEFGYFLDGNVPPERRLSILLSLKEQTVDALLRQKLVTVPILREVAQSFLDDKKANPAIPKFPMEITPFDPEKPIRMEFDQLETLPAQKNDLTDSETSAKLCADVKEQLPNLRERLNRATKETGKMSALADILKVPLASVSRWLSGKREPGGEITLKMLRWVERQERQK